MWVNVFTQVTLSYLAFHSSITEKGRRDSRRCLIYCRPWTPIDVLFGVSCVRH